MRTAADCLKAYLPLDPSLGYPSEHAFPFFFFLSKIVHFLIEIARYCGPKKPGRFERRHPLQGGFPHACCARGNSKAN